MSNDTNDIIERAEKLGINDTDIVPFPNRDEFLYVRALNNLLHGTEYDRQYNFQYSSNGHVEVVCKDFRCCLFEAYTLATGLSRNELADGIARCIVARCGGDWLRWRPDVNP